jgi:hypothetical protein
MLSTTVTHGCPRWCVLEHPVDTRKTVLHHASETAVLTISRPGDSATPDRIEVQSAQYLSDEQDGAFGSSYVEIAVYVAHRYRLIGLTPDEARELARVLLRAADALVPRPESRRPGSSA